MGVREEILDRLRVAIRASVGNNVIDEKRHEEREAERGELQRRYRRTSHLDPEQLLALFEERIRHYNGTPFRCGDSVPEAIAEILHGRGKRIVVVPPAFPQSWRPPGFFFIPDENLTYDQLNSNDGVLTLCTLGIASTGTVVLASSREQGRRAATLVPDYHLCVLGANTIVELVPEALRALQQQRMVPLTFFSGPSATVDIEMTRVRGVHGPRTLDVLIV